MRVAAGQKPSPQIRFANSPTGIDPWSQDIAQMIGAWCAVQAPRHPIGRLNPRVRAGHDLEALAHKGPVYADQGRDIGHCGQGHKIERIDQRLGAVCPVLASSEPLASDHKDNRRRAEMGQSPVSSCRFGFTTARASGWVSAPKW